MLLVKCKELLDRASLVTDKREKYNYLMRRAYRCASQIDEKCDIDFNPGNYNKDRIKILNLIKE